MSAATAAADPAQRSPMRIRHGVLAAALLAVAGLRLATGDHLWAAVLGGAGLVELWLARREARAVDSPSATPAGPTARPDREVLLRSRDAHARAARLWTVVTVTALAAAALLLVDGSVLAAVLGGLALLGLQRTRRERRSVDVLGRALGTRPPEGSR